MPPVSRSHGGHHSLPYSDLLRRLASKKLFVHTQEPSVENSKAEYRNRTDDERLETFSFTSKLNPQSGRLLSQRIFLHTRGSIRQDEYPVNWRGWIRTSNPLINSQLHCRCATRHCHTPSSFWSKVYNMVFSFCQGFSYPLQNPYTYKLGIILLTHYLILKC